MTSDTPQKSHVRSRITGGRLAGIILAVAVAAGLAWLGWRGYQLYKLAQRLNDSIKALRNDVQTLQDADDLKKAITTTRSDLAQVRSQLAELQDGIAPFEGLLDNLGWLPKYGPDLASIPPIIEAANGLVSSISALDGAFGPVMDRAGDGTRGNLDPASVLDTMDRSQAQLAEAHTQLDVAKTARARIAEPGSLTPFFAKPVDELDKAIAMLDHAMIFIDAAPLLLGDKEPHRVLILIQNADELRATGGFITYSGYAVIENGEIKDMTFIDSKSPEIDRVDLYTYDDPPSPMLTYMDLPTWLFRDANWSPDFPTSAQKAIDLYKQGMQVPVDTVIAIDQSTISPYLQASGPITLPDGSAADAKNFVSRMRGLWSESNVTKAPKSNKVFIADLAPLFVKHVLQSSSGEMLKYLQVTRSVINQKHLLIYSRRPEIQRLAEDLGADGGIASSRGDYVYVVDSNIGFNKTNLRVTRTLSYHVSLANMPRLYSVLDMEYHNDAPGNFQGTACKNGEKPTKTYEDRADDCYADYLRVYLPQGSEIVAMPSFDIPADYNWFNDPQAARFVPLSPEAGKDVVGGLLVLPAESSTQAEFSYAPSPSQVLSMGPDGALVYRLTIQKQPGSRADPLKVTVDLPSGSTLLSVTPKPTYASNDVVYLEGKLGQDVSLQITLKVPNDVMQNVAPLFTGAQVAEAATPGPRSVQPGPPLPTAAPTPTAEASITTEPSATSESAAPIMSSLLATAILRSGPGKAYAVVQMLDQGTEVRLLGRNFQANWVYVSLPDGVRGWLAIHLLKQPFNIFKLVRVSWPDPTAAP